MKRRDRETSTICPYTECLARLKERHRNTDTAWTLVTEFAAPVSATTARPSDYAAKAQAAVSTARQREEREETGNDEDLEDTCMAYQIAASTGNAKTKQRKQRRCRKCGLPHALSV